MRDGAVYIAVFCSDCKTIGARSGFLPLSNWEWPSLCKRCGNITCKPAKDGTLDNPEKAWNAQVAIETQERKDAMYGDSK